MTYIEFFDKTASENICACLSCAPERVIFIGDNGKLMKKHIQRYQRILEERGIYVEYAYKTFAKNDLGRAVELITEIIEEEEACTFDITGGDELLNLALGIVYGRNLQKNIQIQRMNLRSNTVYYFDQNGSVLPKKPIALTVQENIRLYGGDIRYGGADSIYTFCWDMNPEFEQDIDRIWEVCREDVKEWNTQIGIFQAADKVGRVSEDGLTTVAARYDLEKLLDKTMGDYGYDERIIQGLFDFGLLTSFCDDGEFLTLSYKNRQVKKVLNKEGLALEMKVFVSARTVRDSSGCAVYNDAMNGVVIDWDGAFHDSDDDGVYDTINEVDVILMHGVIPVFISCKNGYFTADELFKLNSVAEQFGNEYARKVLVATGLERNGDSDDYIRQRAKDMNIKILENVQNLDKSAFDKLIKNLWNN